MSDSAYRAEVKSLHPKAQRGGSGTNLEGLLWAKCFAYVTVLNPFYLLNHSFIQQKCTEHVPCVGDTALNKTDPTVALGKTESK